MQGVSLCISHFDMKVNIPPFPPALKREPTESCLLHMTSTCFLVTVLYNSHTYNIYIITPSDHMSHDMSYFSDPNTSGAEMEKITKIIKNTNI